MLASADDVTPWSHARLTISGLGLGLSIARRNVQDDGGFLSVTDRPCEGCTFTIDLPPYALVK